MLCIPHRAVQWNLVAEGEVIAVEPRALRLRYLTTMSGLAADRSSIIIFPFPMELLKAFTHGKPMGEEKDGKSS